MIMKKIATGWYRNELEGFDVYLTSRRTDQFWNFRIHGEAVVSGFVSKKQATEAAHEHLVRSLINSLNA